MLFGLFAQNAAFFRSLLESYNLSLRRLRIIMISRRTIESVEQVTFPTANQGTPPPPYKYLFSAHFFAVNY
jgi:hypothetical protein